MRVPFVDSLLVWPRIFHDFLLTPARAATTLAAVRGDLSHEASAKIARLAALLREWDRGRYEPGDFDEAHEILLDLGALVRDHCALASETPACLPGLIRLLSAISRTARRLRTREAFSHLLLRAMEADLERIRLELDALVDRLSTRHAARLGDLLTGATSEIRREKGGGVGGRSVPIVTVADRSTPTVWVPASDARRWIDLLRNLVRNAVEATEAAALKTGAPPPAVEIRTEASGPSSGLRMEIVDQGIGMTPEESATIWEEGRSRRGGRHGMGLTQEKLRFLEGRGTVDVSSEPGRGTLLRIDVRPEEIPILPPRRVAPTTTILLAVALAGGGALAFLARPPRPLASVQIEASRAIGYDDRLQPVFEVDMGMPILTNHRNPDIGPFLGRLREEPPTLLRDASQRVTGALVSTLPAAGPGEIRCLDARGKIRWTRPIRWDPPKDLRLGKLVSMWQTTIPWTPPGESAIMIDVRDARYGEQMIEFLDLNGDSLGAYFHPGLLQPFGVEDFDGDGRAEVLLCGVSNAAVQPQGFLPCDPGVPFLDCLVLLEPPAVSGQGYPYRSWVDQPPAKEEGYLVLPPLRHGERPQIRAIDIGSPSAGGGRPIEVTLEDGRMYRLDPHLRPIRCGTGNETPAERLAPIRPLGPLLYIAQGEIEQIDLAIDRGLPR